MDSMTTHTISRAEAARRLGITEQSVIYWENSNYITRQMDGRKVVYDVGEVVEQAMKNARIREAAEKLAADYGLLDWDPLTSRRESTEASSAASDLVASDDLARKQVEIDLLRERVEAQEREIERLHVTLQRLAER